jgi:hypothetical protein
VRIGRVGGSKVVVHAPGREDHLTFTPSSVELTTKVS